jgi:signal transduction histidine kinase
VEALRETHPFAETSAESLLEALAGVESVERVSAQEGAVLVEPLQPWSFYWLLLKGETRAERPEKDGTLTLVGVVHDGEGFGEVPLLAGKGHSPFLITVTLDSVLLRFTEPEFWKLMACCAEVRKVVLSDMAQRLQAYQVEALHREKLVSLGTLAAGLMHELHNPGAAAKRAASQLRENLKRLQEMSLRSAGKPKTQLQLECMHSLLEHAVRGCHAPALSSVDQSDAEEAMSEWLQSEGVENAFTIGPALVAIGFDREELRCAREAFEAGSFSDALNWLEALVSSMSLVCAIEESITRVSDLVIDNAADASPEKGQIEIATWNEGGKGTEPGWLAVSIADHGAGIPVDVKPRIFEAFFTTKPQGSGTGLGLEIVHRIVTQKFGGTIAVESEPGNTKFIVRLPVKAVESSPKSQG